MRTNTKPRIAAVVYEDGAALNQVFSEVVESLRARGIRLGGVIQNAMPNHVAGKSACCGGLGLEDLSLGEDVAVTQNLGEGATDCHLDANALAQVAKSLTNQLTAPDLSIDLFIINRFGLSESEGHGMFDVFSEALMQEIPVLTAVKKDHLESWENWHGGIAQSLAQDKHDILEWCLSDS
ncbi:DUF2478 domain-containing protein [uncultured Cocleimonas sp.]|uniref:DUF2478 domain-containing protein n=1 Tax=uncultured Cocleimonas sp. TaxID=1051587 RepID=UPI0026254DDF|nr:DUF2478 domain-containing protein [uncultured Cocleimonas sp.]